jgi:hypothetical protein
MALLKCYECGHQVSSSAASCPGCGALLNFWRSMAWRVGTIVVACLFVLLLLQVIVVASVGSRVTASFGPTTVHPAPP